MLKLSYNPWAGHELNLFCWYCLWLNTVLHQADDNRTYVNQAAVPWAIADLRLLKSLFCREQLLSRKHFLLPTICNSETWSLSSVLTYCARRAKMRVACMRNLPWRCSVACCDPLELEAPKEQDSTISWYKARQRTNTHTYTVWSIINEHEMSKSCTQAARCVTHMRSLSLSNFVISSKIHTASTSSI